MIEAKIANIDELVVQFIDGNVYVFVETEEDQEHVAAFPVTELFNWVKDERMSDGGAFQGVHLSDHLTYESEHGPVLMVRS